MTGDQVFAAGAQLLDGIAYLEGQAWCTATSNPANVMLDQTAHYQADRLQPDATRGTRDDNLRLSAVSAS